MTERRQQLIDAAVRVFAERGFRGATTHEIAAAAGVTEAVIFQHFPDKDTLYSAILEQKARERQAVGWLSDIRTRAEAGDTAGVLQTLYDGLIGQHERDPDFLRLTVYSALEQHPLSRRLQSQGLDLYNLLESFVVAGQRSGAFRPGPPPILVRALLALPIYYVLQRQVFRTPWPAADREEVVTTGVQIALAGLSNPRPRHEAAS